MASKRHDTTKGGPLLERIDVVPRNVVLVVGDTRQLVAIAHWSGGTELDVTASVTWQSGDPSAATVDASGLVTAVDVGATSITASLGPNSGGASVSVHATPGNDNDWYYPISLR